MEMRLQRNPIVSLALTLLALTLLAVPASAGPIVYVVNAVQQFGTLDLVNGNFHQIGPLTPEGVGGLVAGRDGSLLTAAFSGNVYSINPGTGVFTLLGPSGLADCTDLTVPCGPNAQGNLGGSGGSVYTTDFAQNLYQVNSSTGAATLIGPTGIPAVPSLVPNADGSFTFFDESLFGAGGNLYAYFDAAVFDPSTFSTTTLVPARLYQLNPSTGGATALSPTQSALSTVFNVNGVVYAFDGMTGYVHTLDLSNGSTSLFGAGSSELFISGGPAAGLILGASAVPEPGSIAMVGMGIFAVAIYSRRRSILQRRIPGIE